MVKLIVLAILNDRDNVKSYFFGNISACKVEVGCSDEVFLFLWGDEGFRFSKCGVAACFHLAKDDAILVMYD